MGNPPETYDQLRAALQSRFATLAPGQQRIARILLDDPEGTAFRSIGQTAELAGVHRSSLVRFAALFGLQGYPSLVRVCRQQLATKAHLVARFEQAQAHTATAELLGAVTERDTGNIASTMARLDHADWERAVELLADAPAVHVIGLRKCFSVGYLTSYLLHMVRPRVRQIATTTGLLVDELRDMQEGEVLVAVSIRRYTSDTVRAIEHARRAGLHTIALTDEPSSPLARSADLSFYVDTGSVTVLRSLTAFTAVVQALATAVALRRGARSRDELAVDEELLDAFAVYAEAPSSSGAQPIQPGVARNA